MKKSIHYETTIHEQEAVIDYLETKVERLEVERDHWKWMYESLIREFPTNEEHF